MEGKRADLVLEGAGVKGVGLVGAVSTLAEAGYHFPRVAGTSAGAVVGAYVVALQHAGEPLSRLEDIARSLNYAKMRDRGVLGRAAGPLSRVVDGLSLAFDGGVFEGDYLRSWVKGALADLGVRTFGDLRQDDPGSSLPEDLRYSLLVTASDVSRKRFVRLPWDYRLYGLDPDEQEVADAVRASASIPFFFEPVTLRSHGPDGPQVSTLVDGGVLSNFPVAVFDRTDGRPPRWPTFGVRLLPDLPAGLGDLVPFYGLPMFPAVRLLEQVVATTLVGRDQTHLERPGVRERTMTVDTKGTAITDFGIGLVERRQLIERGGQTAREFLANRQNP